VVMRGGGIPAIALDAQLKPGVHQDTPSVTEISVLTGCASR
jgi:hypothetical protein